MNSRPPRWPSRSAGPRLRRGAPACAVACLLLAAQAAPPPDLPGEDITEDYIRLMMPADSIVLNAPRKSPRAAGWLDEMMKTWDAPPLEQQIAEDATLVPMGKGAVFIPRMGDRELEPDVEIIDSTGELITRGKPGGRFNTLPGTCFVMLGSGSHKQNIVRKVLVEECRTVPLVPDWAGLSIDVSDENNIQFRGEYELVRIDEFEPFGRGFGADPDLGETPKTWILKPGLYKIVSVGESYNTLRNFVTVQLLPGQFVRLLLIESEPDYRIQGGGIVDVRINRALARNWKYGVDIGGSALFNATIDRRDRDESVNSTTIALLLKMWLRFEKKPVDWLTSLRFDEGLTLPQFDFSRIENTIDDLRQTSLFVWRFLPWFGPYGRFEAETDLFPKQVRRGQNEQSFYIIDGSGRNIDIDTTDSWQTEDAFSPYRLEAGVGANIDIVDTRPFNARSRAGFGYSFDGFRNRYRNAAVTDVDSATRAADSAVVSASRILERVGTVNTHQYGPEVALNMEVRIGKFALATGEIKVFAPIAPELRLLRPDLDIRTLVSWRLSQAITLDYEWNYSLLQPENPDLKTDLMEHRVLVRYSFRSR